MKKHCMIELYVICLSIICCISLTEMTYIDKSLTLDYLGQNFINFPSFKVWTEGVHLINN